MERLYRSLKSEFGQPMGYPDLPTAESDGGEYSMNYYKQYRPHSYSSDQTPVAADKT